MSININHTVKIAVVGDIHQLWQPEDESALIHLGVDLVLFVGDYGNESVEVVRQIASIELPFAAVMGNHDAWYTASSWGRARSPYNHKHEDRVQQQLDLLGLAHVGYGKLDFPQFNLSVVGGRPFSWGGPEWRNRRFLQERFGVEDFSQSQAKIVAAATRAETDTIIMLNHNGPIGLGEEAEAICGKDWGAQLGGDYGDPDLAGAIAEIQAMGKSIPLVAFGHMHHRLRHTSARLRTAMVEQDRTIYLNAAFVPRIQNIPGADSVSQQRHFALVEISQGQVQTVSQVWLDEQFETVNEQILYETGQLTTTEV